MKTYTSYLGLSTGNVIRLTPWRTGPHEIVTVSRPSYVQMVHCSTLVIFPYPLVHVSCMQHRLDGGPSGNTYINDIRRGDDGYHYVGLDRLDVDYYSGGYAQLDMFAASDDYEPTPYQFTPGVDYTVLDCELWHCPRCKADYNALKVPVVDWVIPGDPRGRRPLCPRCAAWPDEIFVVHPGDYAALSYSIGTHHRMMDQYRKHCPERIAYWLGTGQ